MVAGSLLSARYRMDEQIAVGGMGAVYAATDERLDRRVAVKVLKEGLADDPRFVERFRREARAAGALTHPNVAAVYDFGEDGGRSYMIMELAHGRDLARVLREEGPLSPERTVRIGSQIAWALDHAHAAGLIHRDVKPANVILDDNDRVKVTDFGIARAVGDSTLTATGSVLGTAHYISPEQAGGGQVGPASDIYSLGIVLYEMLTGSLPFTGDSAVAVAMRHVSDEVPPPSELNPEVPAALDVVIARATAKEPGARYASAAELAGGLEGSLGATDRLTTRLAAGVPAAAVTQELGQTVWPIPGGRYDPQRLGRRVLAVLGALAVIALMLLMLRLGNAEEQPSELAGSQNQQARQTPVQNEEQPEAPAAVVVSEEWIGNDFHEVEKLLKDAGVEVTIEEVPSEDLPEDAIVYTDPGSGASLQEGDRIVLFVSDGGAVEEEEEEAQEDEPEEADEAPGNSEDKGPKEPKEPKDQGKGKDD